MDTNIILAQALLGKIFCQIYVWHLILPDEEFC